MEPERRNEKSICPISVRHLPLFFSYLFVVFFLLDRRETSIKSTEQFDGYEMMKL